MEREFELRKATLREAETTALHSVFSLLYTTMCRH
ncbi:hypothetical protein PC128_g9230 [Phytophthora cactorum]|nr:hypothetical protein PC128_g9230 [Phytophthora cactorum]